MYATDFEFDGKLASEYGLVVCTWGDESDVAEGGNIEPNVIKPPNRDTFDWYGGQFNEPLKWNVSIANSMCSFTVVKEEDIIGSSSVSYLKDELQYYQDVSVDTEDLPEDLTQFYFYLWNADSTFDTFYQISKADLDDFILDIKDKGQLMMMPVLGTPTSSSYTYKFNFTTLSDMDSEISIEKERAIARWLMKPGYKWTRFLNDRDGSESLWYKCNVSVTPHQLFGTTIGFDLVFTSNCAYGFTDEQVRTHTINSSGSWRINVNTDINEYVYPIVTLNGIGEVELYNENDLEQNLTNAKQTKVKIRSDITNEINKVITGSVSASSGSHYISSPYVFEFNVTSLEDRDIQISQNIEAVINPDVFDDVGLRIQLLGSGGSVIETITTYDRYYDLTLGDSVLMVVGQVLYEHDGISSAYTEQFDCTVQIYNAGNVVIDSDNDIVTGIVNPKTDFNYYFLHLINGVNKIKTTSEADVDIEIKYREARRVIL